MRQYEKKDKWLFVTMSQSLSYSKHGCALQIFMVIIKAEKEDYLFFLKGFSEPFSRGKNNDFFLNRHRKEDLAKKKKMS